MSFLFYIQKPGSREWDYLVLGSILYLIPKNFYIFFTFFHVINSSINGVSITANAAYDSRVINMGADKNAVGLQWTSVGMDMSVDNINIGTIAMVSSLDTVNSNSGKLHILAVIPGSDGSYSISDIANYKTIVISLVRGNSIIGNTLIPKDIFVLGSQHITSGYLSFADIDFRGVAINYVSATSVSAYFKHQGTYDCVIYGLK